MPKAATEESALKARIKQAEQALESLKEQDICALSLSQDAQVQLPVQMSLAFVGYDDLSWASAQDALRNGRSFISEVLSMEGDQFVTRRTLAAIAALGRVDPGPLQRRDDVAYAIAAYLEACLRSAGYRLGLRAPVVAAAATGSGAIPPAWPIKIQFQEIMHKVDEASRWNRTAFVVCAGHAQEADTFLSYRGFTTIDACAIVRDVFLTKESTIADVRKLLHKQLLDSMRCGLPLHIAMSSSALDFKGTICKDYVFPASLFNTSLFRKPLEYSKVLSDDDRRGWALNIVDRMKSDFFVLITTDMDIANATAYLADAVPYLDDAALIELDPSSFEAEFRAMEARKSERLSAKYGQRASDNVG